MILWRDSGESAKIGDLVEVISPQGIPTGVKRLVLGVMEMSQRMDDPSFKYLYLEGEDYKIRAAYARIVSRARRK